MKNRDLDMLKNKCLLFNQFMIEKGGFPIEMRSSFIESNNLIIKAYEGNQIGVLKSMSNDIDNQVSKHMPLSMALDLKRLFKKELDIDFEAVDKARLKEIDRIIKRGKIVTPNGYELLVDHVDEIKTDITKSNEIKLLNNLLLSFDANDND